LFFATDRTDSGLFENSAIRGVTTNVGSGTEAGALAFFTATAGGSPSERMRVHDGGEVSIGTTSASGTLDVQNPSGTTTVYIGKDSPAENSGFYFRGGAEFYLDAGSNDAGSQTYNILDGQTSTSLFSARQDGVLGGLITSWGSSATQDIGFSVTTGNGSFEKFTSSRRYKTAIRDLSFDTEAIYQLVAKEFIRIDSGLREFGYIAEDVADIVPQLTAFQTRHVSDNGKGKVSKEIEFVLDENNQPIPESVHYRLLTVLQNEEMKKLRKRVENLEKRAA
jgi:hypothetical protein